MLELMLRIPESCSNYNRFYKKKVMERNSQIFNIGARNIYLTIYMYVLIKGD